MLRSSKKWLPVLLVLGLSQDCQGSKPIMSPAKPEIYIDEGDSLELTCTNANTMRFYYPKDVTNRIKTSLENLNEQSLSDEQKIIFRRAETVHGDTGWYGCADRNFDVIPGIYDQIDVSWTYVYVRSNTSYFVQLNVLQAFPEVTDGTVTLPCRPTSPHSRVILTADDEEIHMGEKASYDPRFGFQLRNMTFNDRGYFRCLIQEGDTIQGVNFHLHFIWNLRSPDLKIIPSVIHVSRNGTSYVSCTIDVDADIPYVFNWTTPHQSNRINTRLYKETIALNKQTIIGVLKINEATDEDEGEYECTMTTSSAQIKHKISIMVYDPVAPSISETNMNKTMVILDLSTERYKVLILKCYVEGLPKPNVAWYKDGKRISANEQYAYHYDNQELHIKYLLAQNSGRYTCKVENRFGKLENCQIILVIGKPSVDLDSSWPVFYYLPKHKDEFSCHIMAWPAPNVTWTFLKALSWPTYKESEMVQLKNYSVKPDYWEFYSVVTMTTETPGRLTCTACNIYGCKSDTEVVYVSDVPNGFGIMETDEMKTELTVGDDVELICAGASGYYLKVDWLYGLETCDAVTTTDEMKTAWTHHRIRREDVTARISITNSLVNYTYHSTLRIKNLQQWDNHSEYICEASGFVRPSSRSKLTLLIHDPMAPSISETNMNKTTVTLDLSTERNKVVILKCHVEGLPKPSVIWYKDGMRILANEQYEYRYDNQELYIKYLLAENSGNYTCKAENRFGKHENYQIIAVKVKNVSKVLIIPTVVLVLICAILVIYLYIKRHREKVMHKQLMEAGLTHFEEGALQCLNPNLTVHDQAELLPYDKKWEFPRERLKFGKQLGFGAFGVVMKADALGICKDETVSTVAVKMVRKSTACTYIRALARELKILVHLGKHLNVVNLLGACTKNIMKRELLVIIEYCRFGNLHNYLLRHRADFINQIDPATLKIDVSIGLDLLAKETTVGSNNSLSANSSNSNPGAEQVPYTTGTNSQDTSMSPDGGVLSNNSTLAGCRLNYKGNCTDHNLKPLCTQTLLSWAFQIARGMEYLSQRKVLHGDLAARNILLAENNIVKICDFGLAKTMYKDDNYKKQGGVPLPIKWMAIESIKDRIFSTQSDVWSFGIVFWELFTLAETPYPSMEPKMQYQRLIEGYRMEQPEYATDEVYDIMLQCWKEKPTLRPTFTYLVSSIGDLLEETVKEHYVKLNGPYMDMNTMALESGKENYLMMMSAPDYHALVSPNNDDVNALSLPPVVPRGNSYISMSRTNNEKSNVHSISEWTALELSPMLNHKDDNYL